MDYGIQCEVLINILNRSSLDFSENKILLEYKLMLITFVQHMDTKLNEKLSKMHKVLMMQFYVC